MRLVYSFYDWFCVFGFRGIIGIPFTMIYLTTPFYQHDGLLLLKVPTLLKVALPNQCFDRPMERFPQVTDCQRTGRNGFSSYSHSDGHLDLSGSDYLLFYEKF